MSCIFCDVTHKVRNCNCTDLVCAIIDATLLFWMFLQTVVTEIIRTLGIFNRFQLILFSWPLKYKWKEIKQMKHQQSHSYALYIIEQNHGNEIRVIFLIKKNNENQSICLLLYRTVFINKMVTQRVSCLKNSIWSKWYGIGHPIFSI